MNAIDNAETLIISALECTDLIDKSEQDTGMRRVVDGQTFKVFVKDQGILLKFKDMVPSCAYTVDGVDSERIFTSSPAMLITPAWDIIGDDAEVMVIKNSAGADYLQWMGFRKACQPRKSSGICCLGKPFVWYEMHVRTTFFDGRNNYTRRIIPLDSKGNPLPAKISGNWICGVQEEGVSFIIAASMIEDAMRPNAMLVSLQDAIELRFPVPISDYKEVFQFRDGPIVGNRRRAIVHWVMKHARRSIKGTVHDVKRHFRGVQEIVVDGLKVRISPNENYQACKTSLAARAQWDRRTA